MSKCIQAIALGDNFQYVIVKSNKEVMILQCAIGVCKWSLHASCCIHEDRSLWVLTRFDYEHTCSVDVPLTDHRQATFIVIKDLIKNKISLAGSKLSTPKDIVHFIRAEHGLNISYQKAWRTREAALDDIHRSLEDSYKMLSIFAYILELNNPCSVVEYKVDTDVISIDETSLKNKYGDTLLSASTLDANDKIFPLAFYVVDSENDSSWTWFCNQLKRIIGGQNEVVIVSDRRKSICKAIEVVFPNVLHCICLVHLLRNLKLKYKRIVDTVFRACGKIFNIVDFEHKMYLLESSALGIREELESIGFAKWSRAYSPRRRYDKLPICFKFTKLKVLLGSL
ncbi:protein FAR-RED ELONGATED HYPOCOTYL 3-like [Cucumis melo]|uniref:Protein FAR-RED ELONGATED HYPOCOTYL 3-like n=1 Tax=Cucumis melo TaxID=3656 RepID=A0A1S3CLS8_CUCME|nr:protein FAR-RED ELONGATED HYPOCOTYL 3-like [Cucumis melo]